jgi:hypothetical protein
MDIRKFGQRLKVEENKANKTLKEKDIFIENITLLETCIERSDKLFNEMMVDFYMYEEPFLQIIENLLFMKYGEIISELIAWYVYDRKEQDGTIHPLVFEEEGQEPKEIIIKTPEELWKFIDKNLKLNK